MAVTPTTIELDPTEVALIVGYIKELNPDAAGSTGS